MAAIGAQQHRERMARKSRDSYAAVSDIGEIPAVVNPERKDACRANLRLFLTTYFPNTTGLKPFSDKHVEAILRLQYAILEGGRFLNVFPRGYAKSTIGENAALWAVLYGHRRFVPIFGASQKSAEDSIASLKMELDQNDLLYEDFPEICHAVRKLENKPQRCKSQTYGGVPTHIEYTADKIALPFIEGAAGAGAAITTLGLLSGSRGMRHKRPDGVQQRPDFAIIDDPQKDESAASPAQVAKRLNTIRRSIMRLGGHDKPLACVVNATMIEEGDLVNQLMQDSSWQSMLVKMVQQFPDCHNEKWLGDYARIRQTYDPTDPTDQARAHREATQFYAENMEEMNKGAIVSWPHCYQTNELSAVQHAYNILIDDGPFVFASECQNEPLPKMGERDITAADIAGRLSTIERGRVPSAANILTVFFDVQQTVLYYAVVAWGKDFSGWVVDYGTFPEQRRNYFTLGDINPTLADVIPNTTLEGLIGGGLTQAIARIVGRPWKRIDGTDLHVSLAMADEGYQTEVVRRTLVANPYAGRLKPSKGQSVKASHQKPIHEFRRKPGDNCGLHWRESLPEGERRIRHVLFDTNFWKSFVYARLAVPVGDTGALTLFGSDIRQHRMIADHLTSEYRQRITNESTGRTVDEWALPPNKPDNHLFDCIVGCAVAASICGAALEGMAVQHTRKPKLKLSEIYASKR